MVRFTEKNESKAEAVSVAGREERRERARR